MTAPNWNGLLQWSLKHQSGEPSENVRQIPDEDKAWLEEALSSVSVDIGQQMTSMKSILDSNGPETEEVVQQKEAVLDGLVEIVENIDYARDLNKIGGMSTLMRLLSDKEPSLRWRAAEVIATCAQLNEPVQKDYLEADCISKLLQLLSDQDPTCRQKSLLALSCLIRNNEEGLDRFLQSHGTERLIKVVTNDQAKNQRKALQLLAYIASEQPQEIPSQEVSAFVPSLIQSDSLEVREATILLLIQLSKKEQHDILSKDKAVLDAIEGRLKSLSKVESGDDLERVSEERQNLVLIQSNLRSKYTREAERQPQLKAQNASSITNDEQKLSPPLLLN